MTSTAHADNDQRNRSGLRLYRQHGDGIEWIRGEVFLVPSRSKATRNVHEVDLGRGTCQCEDCTLGGHRCAHIVAATIWIAKHLTAKRLEAEKRANVSRSVGSVRRRTPPDFVRNIGNIERMTG